MAVAAFIGSAGPAGATCRYARPARGGTGLVDHTRLGREFSVRELAVPDEWIGRSLRDLELPRAYRVSVLALHDVLKDEFTPVPDPDALLKESDTIFVAGADADLEKLVARLE